MENLDKTADVILCFGSARFEQYNRKESYRWMAVFLKPNGKTIYEIFKEEKHYKITTVFLKNTVGICSIVTWKRVMYVKVMTKQEATSHAENHIIGAIYDDCTSHNYSVIIDADI